VLARVTASSADPAVTCANPTGASSSAVGSASYDRDLEGRRIPARRRPKRPTPGRFTVRLQMSRERSNFACEVPRIRARLADFRARLSIADGTNTEKRAVGINSAAQAFAGS